MITFAKKHPDVDLGLIPYFLNANDPRPASKQIHENYQHGGGWSPLSGFKMLSDGRIQYGEEPDQDEPLEVLAEAKLREETIRFYEGAWVAVVQPDGSFEASRID